MEKNDKSLILVLLLFCLFRYSQETVLQLRIYSLCRDMKWVHNILQDRSLVKYEYLRISLIMRNSSRHYW